VAFVSPTIGRVYCFACKHFCHSVSPFIELGFSDWKKAEEKTKSHENSAQHWQSEVKWLIRANKKQSTNRHMAEEYKNHVKSCRVNSGRG
jgi:hypothetical protein